MNAAVNKKYLSPMWWREAIVPRLRAYAASVNFEPHVVEKRIGAEAYRFFIANPTGKAWYGRNVDKLSLEMEFARRHLLHPGATVIECGAHHGHDTIVLSRSVGPHGRVVAVEPLPENVAIIRRNCELNGLKNVTVVAAALGAASGAATLRNTSNGAIETAPRAGGVSVSVATLDELCAQAGLRPDFIKMDVEGYEVAVLQGAQRTLLTHPNLHIEIHPFALPRFGHSVTDLWNLIDLQAYQLWLQLNDSVPPARIEHAVPVRNRAHLYCARRA